MNSIQNNIRFINIDDIVLIHILSDEPVYVKIKTNMAPSDQEK